MVPINALKPSANRTALSENLNSTKGAQRATMKLLTGWFMATVNHITTRFMTLADLWQCGRLTNGRHRLKARRWCTVHMTNRLFYQWMILDGRDGGPTPCLLSLQIHLCSNLTVSWDQTAVIRFSLPTGKKTPLTPHAAQFSYRTSCRSQSSTFSKVCSHPANWTVTQLGKITVTVQLTSRVYKSPMSINEAETAKWEALLPPGRSRPWADNHSVAAFCYLYGTIREGETLHWYLNRQNYDHKNKALDL